ncbi:nitrogen fixation protein NifQ, partial [Staphylococcus aureus]
RASLGRLLGRHFGALASRNTHGMRWKRFFYRALCEEEGYEHCTSPSCGACSDVEKCFVPESAEAIIARAKKGPA